MENSGKEALYTSFQRNEEGGWEKKRTEEGREGEGGGKGYLKEESRGPVSFFPYEESRRRRKNIMGGNGESKRKGTKWVGTPLLNQQKKRKRRRKEDSGPLARQPEIKGKRRERREEGEDSKK